MSVRVLVVCVVGLAALACREEPRRGPPARPSAKPPAASARSEQLLAAEQRRDSQVISEDDLTSRDVSLRRIAARALARIADARAADLLGRSLADEDGEVSAWSAYGLGLTCEGRTEATIGRLVARAATLAAQAGTRVEARITPQLAIFDALARCGTSAAERTLRAGLERAPPDAELSARALGNFASRHQRLEDASQVALLDAASREPPIEHALFAFTRLPALNAAVQARLIAVAERALSAPGLRRALGIRALGSAASGAADPLQRALLDPSFTPIERADAARQLGRLGVSGQTALAKSLERLAAPERVAAPALLSPELGVLLSALFSLAPEARPPRAVLERLAELALPEQTAQQRRAVHLRCTAARLLAGSASLAPRLIACDPDPKGRIGALAVLAVLDRGELRGARRTRWQAFLKSSDAAVVQAAVELVGRHEELEGAAAVLTNALGSSDLGTVATAAEVLAKVPARARADRSTQPDPKLIAAFTAAFERVRPTDAVEVQGRLIDAAAALELLSAKPAIETFCKSPRAALREHAEQALRRFGERKRSCDVVLPSPPAQPQALAGEVLELVVVTDAGEATLTLDPALAPLTVAELGRLVKSDFYRSLTVHRVVPGFVVQFGDPGGDGFGGSGRTLPSETSPAPFAAGDVGLALAGRDSGSSQLFVTLGSYPHLDGDYPLIGRAGDGWDRFVAGDVIREIRLANR